VKGMAGFQMEHAWQSGLNDGKSDVSGRPAQPPIFCPECRSSKMWKDGLRKTWHGLVQRYLCRVCGFRFSETTTQPKVKVNVGSQVREGLEPNNDLTHDVVAGLDFSIQKASDSFSLFGGEDVGSHGSTVIGQRLNTLSDYSSTRRVCAEESEAKNLDATKKEGSEVAGATTQRLCENSDLIKDLPKLLQVKILEYVVKRLNQGHSEQGVRTYLFSLRTLKRHGADLNDPESVKDAISRMQVSNRTKSLLATAYDSFLAFLGGSWQKPNYTFSQKTPFIPLESEINELIAACSTTVSAFLQVCKETGARKREVAQIEWTDIDFERNIISINHPEKGSNSRQIMVSTKGIKIIDRLPRANKRVFSINSVDKQFYRQRKRIAKKLDNPRLLSISFHTLRHFKGTIEYHKTKDILRVKYILGHKNIRNTLIYIDIENTLFQGQENDEFHVRTAKTIDEACKLLEVGFEYVCEMDEVKLFRKRK